MHFLIGLIVMFISGVAIRCRLDDWKRVVQTYSFTDADVSSHQVKLAIYIVTFIIGFIILV